MVLMTWSLAYTQAANATNGSYVDGFLTYFFDTYLNGKSGFTVGAGGDSFERVMTMTFDDIKGSTSSSYLWYNWTSASNTNCQQYENERYSVTPGDNGDLSAGSSMGGITPPAGGSWRIWESDEKTDAFLVTKGKSGQWFWPGLGSGGKWNLYRDQVWTAGVDNPNTSVGLANWGVTGLPYCNAPGTTGGSSIEYQLNPSIAAISTTGDLGAAYVFQGVGFNYSVDSYGSTTGSTRSLPCIPGGASDQGVYLPLSGTQYPARVSLSDAQLIQNTTDNKYYYYMSSNLSIPVVVLDFGTTEPIFT